MSLDVETVEEAEAKRDRRMDGEMGSIHRAEEDDGGRKHVRMDSHWWMYLRAIDSCFCCCPIIEEMSYSCLHSTAYIDSKFACARSDVSRSCFSWNVFTSDERHRRNSRQKTAAATTSLGLRPHTLLSS
ncbi:hypothetical protein OPV22_018435 [Ensete ventricosum]|uniref:Uncharacterized protein n=1 Tax=Ensete ventricosum TaxID=4639 RepID=A0AAV8PG93_ENSVE|nr:hypothetical protein OPV22_018435 [Ensete ventricosum]